MPREDVEVETGYTVEPGQGKPHTAVINDRKAGRAWSGSGTSANEAITEAVKGMLGDRRAREYVGEP